MESIKENKIIEEKLTMIDSISEEISSAMESKELVGNMHLRM